MVSKLWFLILLLWHLVNSIEIDVGGEISFIGEYAGLSPFKHSTQFESLQQSLVSFNRDDETFNIFANMNGTIETYCKLNENLFILAGNFSTINTTTFNHIVQFNTQTRQLLPLQQGLDAPVHSLYCQNTTAVYVGGDFTAPINSNTSQYSGHVALFNNDQWYPVPWKGFNGPVYSIVPEHNQQSIYFAGQFNSTGNGQYYNQNATYPLIDLSASASISSGNGLESGNYSNPATVLCSQSPWLLQDSMPGYWEATFNYPVQPSIFRLSNANVDDKNTNTFNIISLLTNDYFTLSYTDPITNQITTCSETCYLSNTTTYQDFTVVNTISTSGIRINIDSWYGSAGGLGGVAIYKQDSTLQPEIASMSNSTCSANSMSTTSSTTQVTGNWTPLYSFEAYQNYIVSQVSTSELTTSNVSVTYLPYIPADGVYNVYIYTPGCVGTSSCDQRTQMQLDISFTPGNTTTYTLDQNIVSDQRALIYTGIISATTSAFKPSILMKISPTAQASSVSSVLVFGSSIEFDRNSTASALSSILQYFPSNQTWASLSQQLPANSVVRTLQSTESSLYIGGQFNINNTIANVATYNTTHFLQPLSNNGLNGQVSTSLLIGSNLVLGGSFNDTFSSQSNLGLNHVAIYDTQSNTWSSMNQGVNNNVEHLYSTDQVTVHLSGPFNATTDSTSLLNNAEWNLNTKSWSTPKHFIAGPVSNQVDISSSETLYLGSLINAQTYRADHLASLASTNFTSPLSDPNSTIQTGTYWKNGSDTHLILAGVFHLNNTPYNLIMSSQGEWHGLIGNLTGEIRTLFVVDNTLYIGGNFSSTYADGSPMTSFTMYKLDTQQLQNVAGVFDASRNPGLVNVIYPHDKNVYVGGLFSFAGSLSCNAICMVSTETIQWNQVSDNVSGNVTDMYIGKQVVAVGALVVNNQETVLASIDSASTSMTWNAAPSSSQLQNATSVLYVDDSTYLVTGQSSQGVPVIATWNGEAFSSDTIHLDPASQVQQLLLVPVKSDSNPGVARYVANSNTMLLAVGHIVSETNSSAALYDGERWQPYLLTASSDGTSHGNINRVFTSIPWNASLSNIRHYLSVPAVVLISLAISLGIIFILMLIAFIYLYFKHKNTPVQYYNDPMSEWKPKHRPTSLLAMLNAANLTEPEVVGGGAAAAVGVGAAAVASSSQPNNESSAYSTALDPGTGATHRGQTSMDMSEAARNSSGLSGMAGVSFAALLANATRNTGGATATEDTPKLYYAKYPFEAKEFGELAFEATTPVVVTDTSDNVWWMGYKDDGKGNAVSGLFPSNYVTRTKPPTTI